MPKRIGRVKLSTRLLLPLLAAVVLVMLAYASWSLVQREGIMVAEAERETRAYATALGLALERAAGQGEPEAMQEMIDRIDRDPNIYGVVVYDTVGLPQFVSSPLAEAVHASSDEVRSVLPHGPVRTLRRVILGEESVVVFRPLLDEGGNVRGVLEVVQPLTSVAVQLTRTRQRFILNTLTLIAAVTLLLSWLVRRHLSAPLARFVEAVRALGGGELSHRIEPDTAVGELSDVAEELNRMADRLQGARRELELEAEGRVSLERRLLQAEKLAEVGQLAAGLAHEIGAPLHVIRGRADLVLRGDPRPADRSRNLSIIIEQIDRIAAIVRNLLGYARRREPQLVNADLVAVVRGVVEFVDTESVKGGSRLVVETASTNLVIRCDPDLLHQLFLNVILNALHAVSETGRLGTVAVRISPERLGRGVFAVVEVEDDGSGIPIGQRDRVFEPFFTTKDESRGTGLGLALARAIVEDHCGSIAILPPSRRGWSTRVRIELPITSGARLNAGGNAVPVEALRG
jgi:two-component system NtrC family sensor kinase